MESVPDKDFTVPIGEASIVREGSDITLVAWGQQVPVLEQAVSWGLRGPMLCSYRQQLMQGNPWPAGGSAQEGSRLRIEALAVLLLAATGSRWPGQQGVKLEQVMSWEFDAHAMLLLAPIHAGEAWGSRWQCWSSQEAAELRLNIALKEA